MPKKLNNPDRNAILNAFDLKWTQTQTRYGLEGVTELAQTSYTDNQHSTSVTVGFDGVTQNVIQVETGQNQLENERVQSQTPQGLEGVTELARNSYTNNQTESSVTYELAMETEPHSEKPFWWPKWSDRYDPEFEMIAHRAYWWLLGASTFEGLSEAKERISQLSHNLGWGSHQLLNWLFERMPDDAIDYVEELMAI